MGGCRLPIHYSVAVVLHKLNDQIDSFRHWRVRLTDTIIAETAESRRRLQEVPKPISEFIDLLRKVAISAEASNGDLWPVSDEHMIAASLAEELETFYHKRCRASFDVRAVRTAQACYDTSFILLSKLFSTNE